MATKASLRWAPPRCQAQFDIVYMMHLLNPHEQPCKVLAEFTVTCEDVDTAVSLSDVLLTARLSVTIYNRGPKIETQKRRA